jgi:hypothetical protein
MKSEADLDSSAGIELEEKELLSTSGPVPLSLADLKWVAGGNNPLHEGDRASADNPIFNA